MGPSHLRATWYSCSVRLTRSDWTPLAIEQLGDVLFEVSDVSSDPRRILALNPLTSQPTNQSTNQSGYGSGRDCKGAIPGGPIAAQPRRTTRRRLYGWREQFSPVPSPKALDPVPQPPSKGLEQRRHEVSLFFVFAISLLHLC